MTYDSLLRIHLRFTICSSPFKNPHSRKSSLSPFSQSHLWGSSLFTHCPTPRFRCPVYPNSSRQAPAPSALSALSTQTGPLRENVLVLSHHPSRITASRPFTIYDSLFTASRPWTLDQIPLPIHPVKALPISLAPMSDEQHSNLALLPINSVDHSPITYLIAKMPGQKPLESLDVWMLVGIFP